VFRIYQFSSQLYLAGLCTLIIAFNAVGIVIFMGTILSFANVLSIDALEAYEKKWNWLILSIFSSTAVLDVVITASLCYFLLRQRRDAFKRSVTFQLYHT
jgi:hypothetical protein